MLRKTDGYDRTKQTRMENEHIKSGELFGIQKPENSHESAQTSIGYMRTISTKKKGKTEQQNTTITYSSVVENKETR